MEQEQFYLKTSPLKLFFTAAVPGSISMVAATLYMLFDGIFVGKVLGEIAFAAVGIAFPFVIINFSLSDLIGVGSAVPISINLGKGNDSEANNYFSCSVLMTILTGIFMGLLLFFGATSLMKLIGAEGELASMAVAYVRTYAIFSPLTTIVFSADNYLKICGYVKTSMFINIFMSVLNISLDYVFLCIIKTGVWGTAAAACTSMTICAVIAMTPFIRGKMKLKFVKPKLSLSVVKQIVANGSPIFLNNVSGRVTSIVMNMALLHFGGASAVAVFGIAIYVVEFIRPLLYGIYDSMQPAIGYNFGAGQYKRVKSIQKCCMIAGASISLVLGIIVVSSPEFVAKMFLKPGEERLLSTAVHAIYLFATTYITKWFGFGVQTYLVALSRPVAATVISISEAFVFPMLLILILWNTGLEGLWINTGVTSALVAILAGIILLSLRNKLFFKEQ